MDTQRSQSQQDASDVLRNATFTHSDGPAPSSENAVTASDLLLGAYDPTKLHPMAGIEDKLDYLLLEDDKTSDLPGSGTAIPSRGWSDDLCYGTGTMYLSGTSLFPHLHRHLVLIIAGLNLLPTASFLSHVIAPAALLLSCTITCSPPSWQVLPLVDFGDFARAHGNRWLCQTLGCGSTPF